MPLITESYSGDDDEWRLCFVQQAQWQLQPLSTQRSSQKSGTWGTPALMLLDRDSNIFMELSVTSTQLLSLD